MAFFKKIDLGEGRFIALWKMEEELSQLEAMLPLDTPLSPKRAKEWLTIRLLLRHELGDRAEIAYNEYGAPFLQGGDRQISLSHATGMAAIFVSDKRCGVDIESTTRRYSHVSDRYISPTERTTVVHPHVEAILWSAKEAVFKYLQHTAVNFLSDIRLQTYDSENNRLTFDTFMGIIAVRFFFVDDYVISYTDFLL